MIDHTGLVVSDLGRGTAFYEAVLGTLGYTVLRHRSGAVSFVDPDAGARGGDPAGDFWLTQGEPSEPRSHVAFAARDHAQVEAFHRAALAAGGRDNGPPGHRARYHRDYFAAFVLDPDGYNVEAVCHRPDGRSGQRGEPAV